eukprot:COSAG01_NODE_3650_length_5825_cov_7.891023_3_plen_207_part_00
MWVVAARGSSPPRAPAPQTQAVEEEYMRNMEDARMAKSPVVEKLSKDMADFGTKKQAAAKNFKDTLTEGLRLEGNLYDRDLPAILRHFQSLEERRLVTLADVVGRYVRVFGAAAHGAAAMQPLLELCLAPVDVGFDMDQMAAFEVAVPQPGSGAVPAGYLCVPRRLARRVQELDAGADGEAAAAAAEEGGAEDDAPERPLLQVGTR